MLGHFNVGKMMINHDSALQPSKIGTEQRSCVMYTLWLFNIAMETGPFMEEL